MTRTRLLIGGVLLGMVASVVLAALLLLVMGPASAAPTSAGGPPLAAAATTLAAPAAQLDVAPAAATPDAARYYADLLTHNLATRLGTDQARLNTAFTAAANDTIDQAARDGKLTADQVTQAKAVAGQGLGAVLAAGFTGSSAKGAAVRVGADGGAMQAAVESVLPAIARLFGMTGNGLADALKGGQTLQALEQAHGVSAQQMRDAGLAAIHAALAAGVQSHQWAQADADQAAQNFDANFDNLLMKITGGAAGGNASSKNGADAAPQQAAFEGASTAIAALFGMRFDQLATALRGEQTLLALEQAHHLTEQQVRDAALAGGHTALTAGVQSGQWSQADADAAYQDLSTNVYNVLAKIRNAFEMPVVLEAVQGAVGRLLGLTGAQLADAVKSGQTLQALEQAHHVTDQQVRDTAVAAARTALAAGVQQGQWTQAQADDAFLAFSDTVDGYLAYLGNNRPRPAGGTK